MERQIIEVGRLSGAVATDAIEALMDEFEKTLVAQALAIKVQPYGIRFIETAMHSIMDSGNMRGDPRADDAYIEREVEEPGAAAIDSYVPNGGDVKGLSQFEVLPILERGHPVHYEEHLAHMKGKHLAHGVAGFLLSKLNRGSDASMSSAPQPNPEPEIA
jgi:hypothetical protein